MPIVARETGGSYTPAPAGVHQAVCCDVVDLGIVEITFNGEKKSAHKVRIVWEIDEKMGDGRRFTASKRYTLSLNDKATLRKDLESWRGKAFTPDELRGFDLEKLLGANCMLNVVHSTRDGKEWADIQAIMPQYRGTAKLAVSADYVRVQDRQPTNGNAAPSDEPQRFDPTDEDIPF